jgi:hypothetical protein
MWDPSIALIMRQIPRNASNSDTENPKLRWAWKLYKNALQSKSYQSTKFSHIFWNCTFDDPIHLSYGIECISTPKPL